ncbi:GntR family transcriptional regulator [Brevibacterium album]|uniref:GntR family transcriptional regulator n=1 Tax=Brevibacterium album TaxID=417948 RepID=UPI00041BE0AC|nr:GntR family transcriptional regulator [Brevibacterium album]
MAEQNGAAESVYQRIRALIFDRSIPPGERINIDRLARELGVSQTPVREAVQRLEGDKLVFARRPRGYQTSDLLTEQQLGEMFEVRLLLEPWAARAGAELEGDLGGQLFAEIARFQDEQAHAHGGVHANFHHDVRFHEAILGAVDPGFLLAAFTQLHSHLHLFRLFPADRDGSCTLAEHTAIARAISDGAPEEAETAMRMHLHSSLDRFSEGLREAPAGAPPVGPLRSTG